MDIGTVNFEDLFDFSPEPLDASADVDTGVGTVVDTPTPPSVTNETGFKLSQSVPTNWGASNFLSTNPTTAASATAKASPEQNHFNTSVDQLLETLPKEGVKSKRGRKPGHKNLKTDMKSKLERSRQSARECRARKKLRYQYLDDLILERERANFKLKEELLKYQKWCHELDAGRIPDGLQEALTQIKNERRGGI